MKREEMARLPVATASAADDTVAVIRAEGNYFGAVRSRFVVHDLHMSETMYDDHARIPSHRHECPSFFMPLGGSFIEGCGGDVRQYGPGDVGYHPPHESHWLETHGTRARGFAVEVGDAWRATFGAQAGWDDVPRDLSRSRVSWLMARLHLELYAHDTARPLAIESLGVEIGAELAAARTRSTLRPTPWLDRARDALRDCPGDGMSLGELSRIAGVTPVAVIKAFRRHEGCTPGDYLRSHRLARARAAVAATDRPLCGIALDAGFYDQSHFSRAFKRALGMSPGAYRRAMRA